MVPWLADVREEILKEFHCSRFTVHPGGTNMYHDLCHPVLLEWNEVAS